MNPSTHYRSGIKPKARRRKPHRTAFRAGFAIVAVITVGLAILWRLPKTYEDANPARSRQAISAATRRSQTQQAAEQLVAQLNRQIIGWANYFCVGPVSKA
jgi:hypothetical protein